MKKFKCEDHPWSEAEACCPKSTEVVDGIPVVEPSPSVITSATGEGTLEGGSGEGEVHIVEEPKSDFEIERDSLTEEDFQTSTPDESVDLDEVEEKVEELEAETEAEIRKEQTLEKKAPIEKEEPKPKSKSKKKSKNK